MQLSAEGAEGGCRVGETPLTTPQVVRSHQVLLEVVDWRRRISRGIQCLGEQEKVAACSSCLATIPAGWPPLFHLGRVLTLGKPSPGYLMGWWQGWGFEEEFKEDGADMKLYIPG